MFRLSVLVFSIVSLAADVSPRRRWRPNEWRRKDATRSSLDIITPPDQAGRPKRIQKTRGQELATKQVQALKQIGLVDGVWKSDFQPDLRFVVAGNTYYILQNGRGLPKEAISYEGAGIWSLGGYRLSKCTKIPASRIRWCEQNKVPFEWRAERLARVWKQMCEATCTWKKGPLADKLHAPRKTPNTIVWSRSMEPVPAIEQAPEKAGRKACCKALTAACLACTKDVSLSEYCKTKPTTPGCPKPATTDTLDNRQTRRERTQVNKYECVWTGGVAYRKTKHIDDRVDLRMHGYIKYKAIVEPVERQGDWLRLPNGYWVPAVKNGKKLFEKLREQVSSEWMTISPGDVVYSSQYGGGKAYYYNRKTRKLTKQDPMKAPDFRGSWSSVDFYGGHGEEKQRIEPWKSGIIAVKLTGDPNVPAGKFTWRVATMPKVGGNSVKGVINLRADTSDPNGFFTEECQVRAINKDHFVVAWRGNEGNFKRQITAKTSTRSTQRRPKASEAQTFKRGDRIVVLKTLQADGRMKTRLRRGLVGKIDEIDHEGDALINFDALSTRQWIKKQNFHKLALKSSSVKFKVGQKVTAQWKNNRWYGATVTKANTDGSFALLWDDGYRSATISVSKIKAKTAAGSTQGRPKASGKPKASAATESVWKGMWKTSSGVEAEIKETKVVWKRFGTTSKFEAFSNSTCKLWLRGTEYQGSLQNGRIMWSDGDIWTPLVCRVCPNANKAVVNQQKSQTPLRELVINAFKAVVERHEGKDRIFEQYNRALGTLDECCGFDRDVLRRFGLDGVAASRVAERVLLGEIPLTKVYDLVMTQVRVHNAKQYPSMRFRLLFDNDFEQFMQFFKVKPDDRRTLTSFITNFEQAVRGFLSRQPSRYDEATLQKITDTLTRIGTKLASKLPSKLPEILSAVAKHDGEDFRDINKALASLVDDILLPTSRLMMMVGPSIVDAFDTWTALEPALKKYTAVVEQMGENLAQMIVSASRTPYHLRLAAAGRMLYNGLQSMKKDYLPGMRVRVRGLTQHKQYNGISGVVIKRSPTQRERWMVKLDTKTRVVVKEANLEPMLEHRVSFKNGIFGITYRGTRITRIAAGSQASIFGVQAGWIISTVNNQDVTDENVNNIIDAAKASGGPTIEVTFQGKEKRQTTANAMLADLTREVKSRLAQLGPAKFQQMSNTEIHGLVGRTRRQPDLQKQTPKKDGLLTTGELDLLKRMWTAAFRPII